jgi:hypothetical protein
MEAEDSGGQGPIWAVAPLDEWMDALQTDFHVILVRFMHLCNGYGPNNSSKNTQVLIYHLITGAF